MVEIDEIMEEKLYSYWNGKASHEDQNMIYRWLNESPVHKKQYQELYSLYFKVHSMGVAMRMDVGTSEEKLRDRIRQSKGHSFRKLFFYSGVAACLLVGVIAYFLKYKDLQQEDTLPPLADVVGGFSDVTLVLGDNQTMTFGKDTVFEMNEGGAEIKQDASYGLMYKSDGKDDYKEIVYNSIVVPRGCEYQLLLSDGTKVHLNSESQLKYPVKFQGDVREVYLVGEGFFEVAKDSLHPFFVHSGEMKLQVLGTVFNVSAYQGEDQVAVTLLEGKVQVNTRWDEAILTHGLQAVCSKENGHMFCQEVDVERIVSWTTGMFDFVDMPIQELIVQLGRWYNVDFLIENESIGKMRFTGAVQRNKSLKFILDFLKSTSDIIYEQQGNIIILKIKGR